jgi:hypothetical protein
VAAALSATPAQENATNKPSKIGSNRKPQPPCSVGSVTLRHALCVFTVVLLIAHLPPHDSKRLSPFDKKAPLTSKFIRFAHILTNIEHFIYNT